MRKSKPLRLFLRFLKFILPYRGRYLAILILSGLGALLGLVNPYLSKLIVDEAIGKKDIGLFVILAAVGITVFILTGLIGRTTQFLETYIKLRVNFDLN